MLGKLKPGIKLPLDVAIRDLKKYSQELPNNLYSLSPRQIGYVKRMLLIINPSSRDIVYISKILGIIDKMPLPERMVE